MFCGPLLGFKNEKKLNKPYFHLYRTLHILSSSGNQSIIFWIKEQYVIIATTAKVKCVPDVIFSPGNWNYIAIIVVLSTFILYLFSRNGMLFVCLVDWFPYLERSWLSNRFFFPPNPLKEFSPAFYNCLLVDCSSWRRWTWRQSHNKMWNVSSTYT